MPWTEPHDFVALEVPTADDWDAFLSGNLRWLAEDRPRARVYSSVNIELATATPEHLVFNAVRTQVGAMWSAGAPTRLTVPTGGSGEFMLGAGIAWGASTAGSRKLELIVNNTTVIVADERSAAADNPMQSVTTFYGLNAGDYVEVRCTQSSGGNLNVLTLPNYSPEFWACWQGY